MHDTVLQPILRLGSVMPYNNIHMELIPSDGRCRTKCLCEQCLIEDSDKSGGSVLPAVIVSHQAEVI